MSKDEERWRTEKEREGAYAENNCSRVLTHRLTAASSAGKRRLCVEGTKIEDTRRARNDSWIVHRIVDGTTSVVAQSAIVIWYAATRGKTGNEGCDVSHGGTNTPRAGRHARRLSFPHDAAPRFPPRFRVVARRCNRVRPLDRRETSGARGVTESPNPGAVLSRERGARAHRALSPYRAAIFASQTTTGRTARPTRLHDDGRRTTADDAPSRRHFACRDCARTAPETPERQGRLAAPTYREFSIC